MWWVDIPTTAGTVRFSSDGSEFRHLDTSEKMENVEIIRDFVYSYLCLLADSPFDSDRGKSRKPPSAFRKFYRRLLSQPLLQTITEFADLAHSLAARAAHGDRVPTTGDFMPEFKHLPIFREYLIWHKTGDPAAFRYVYVFLNFGKKLDYADDELHAKALTAWRGVEEKLSNVNLPAMHLQNLRHIMGFMVSLGDDQAKPKFGPGFVAERGVSGVVGKSQNLHYHPKLSHVFQSPLENMGRTRDLGFEDGWLPPSLFDTARPWSDDTSRLKCVPKTVKTARTICMEPNAFMFGQQLVLHRLSLGMTKSKVTRRIVDIHDQATSRYLSWYGSSTGLVDTIDLSAASDSVHVDLVRAIFPRPVLLQLLATRTSRVDVGNGEVVPVRKFAPMGSALCFPVQSLIFASVCVYAAMLHKHDASASEPIDLTGINPVGFVCSEIADEVQGYDHTLYQPMRVYGDDIIVDSRLTAIVLELLVSLGFTPNREKSFTGTQLFREACGGYYLGGRDVTPLFFRLKRWTHRLSPEYVASAVALANEAGDRGYTTLRRYLIRAVRFRRTKLGRTYVPFVHERERWGWYTTSPLRNTHFGEKQRRSDPRNDGYSVEERELFTEQQRHFSRRQIRVTAVVPGFRHEPSDEEIRRSPEVWGPVEWYLRIRYWATRPGADSLYEGMPRADAGSSRLAWRWVPEPD